MSKSFAATVDGITYDDPTLFDADMKAKGRRKLPVPRMSGTWRTPTHKPWVEPEFPAVGARVVLRDGTEGQVWCLSSTGGYVWVATGTRFVEMYKSGNPRSGSPVRDEVAAA